MSGGRALTPSAEQIALAWRQLRGRDGAPLQLDAALRNPVWARALHGLAVCMGRRTAAEHPSAANDAAARLGGPLQLVPPTPEPPPGGWATPGKRGPNLWSRCGPRVTPLAKPARSTTTTTPPQPPQKA
jgi:hypothetical protein